MHVIGAPSSCVKMRSAFWLLALGPALTSASWEPPGQVKESLFLRNFSKAVWDRCAASNRLQTGRVVIMDVGSNTGAFSWELVRQLRAKAQPGCISTESRRGSLQLDVVLFEPAPRFHNKLTTLAAKLNGTFVPLAAWTENTSLSFESKARQPTQGHIAPPANADGGDVIRRRSSVGAIDLAGFMRRTVQSEDVVFLKIDIEGAEYTVIPHLLANGALCRGSRLHLIVEWHLHQVPKEHRLDALALKLALRSTLNHGCKILIHCCIHPLTP